MFTTMPPTLEATLTKTERIMAILEKTPDRTIASIAEEIGCDAETVRRAERRLKQKSEEPVMLALDAISLDDIQTQMRPTGNKDRELMFQELMEDGVELDPIEVYSTPNGNLITDGWTRFLATMALNRGEIKAVIRKGSVEDAIREAAKANSKHGQPRCRETMRQAVLAIISLDGPDMSPAHYAESACVTRYLAQKVLEEYQRENSLEKPKTTTGKDGKVRPVASNGKRASNQPSDRKVGSNGKSSRSTSELKEESDDQVESEPEANDDLDWLENLYRGNGKEKVRDQLSKGKRAKFDEDALIYRRLHAAGFWTAFVKLGNQLTGDKKVGGEKGANYSRLLSWFIRMPHPKDWNLCGDCGGKGRTEDGLKCKNPKCKGNGYCVG